MNNKNDDSLSADMIKLSVTGGDDPLELPEQLKKMAFEDFGETSETRRTALMELRKRIGELPDEKDRLKNTSDTNLIRYIRGRKYDLDRALETTVERQRFENKHPEWMTISDEMLEKSNEFCGLLPNPDSKGRKVLIMFPAKGLINFTGDFAKRNPLAMIQFNIWMFDRVSCDVHVQVAGLVIINMMKAMSQMAPMSHQMATFHFFSHCVAIRLAGAFIIEAPAFVRLVCSLAKVFMSKKIRERFFLIGTDFTDLHALVESVSILPQCLGGDHSDDVSGWVQTEAEITSAERNHLKSCRG